MEWWKYNDPDKYMRILITKTLLRCSAAFLDWTVAELDQMGRRTRKLMTMH